MKALVTIALFLVTASAAHADLALPTPVARVATSYGMFVGDVASREVTLFSDGSSKVTDLRVVRDPQTGREIGRKTVQFNSEYFFEADVMAKITAASLLQTGEKLVDVDAAAPECEDAPGFQYYVLRGDKALTVATKFSCHTSLPANTKLQRSAKYLKADLDNLLKAIDNEPSTN